MKIINLIKTTLIFFCLSYQVMRNYTMAGIFHRKVGLTGILQDFYLHPIGQTDCLRQQIII